MAMGHQLKKKISKPTKPTNQPNPNLSIRQPTSTLKKEFTIGLCGVSVLQIW
jgi:hypothetical protein